MRTHSVSAYLVLFDAAYHERGAGVGQRCPHRLELHVLQECGAGMFYRNVLQGAGEAESVWGLFVGSALPSGS